MYVFVNISTFILFVLNRGVDKESHMLIPLTETPPPPSSTCVWWQMLLQQTGLNRSSKRRYANWRRSYSEELGHTLIHLEILASSPCSHLPTVRSHALERGVVWRGNNLR